MKIKYQLSLVFSCMILLVILIAFAGFSAINNVSNDLVVIDNKNNDLKNTQEILSLINNIQTNLQNSIENRNQSALNYFVTLESSFTQFQNTKRKNKSKVEQVLMYLIIIDIQEYINTFRNDFLPVLEKLNHIQSQNVSNILGSTANSVIQDNTNISNYKTTLIYQQRRLLEIQNKFNLSGKKYIEVVSADIQRISELSRINSISNKRILLFSSFVAIVIGIIVMIAFIYKITTIIKQILITVKYLSEGNLTKKIDIKTKDEFGFLGKNINISITNLHSLIKDIKSISVLIENSMKEQTAATILLSENSQKQAINEENAALLANNNKKNIVNIETDIDVFNNTVATLFSRLKAMSEVMTKVSDISRLSYEQNKMIKSNIIESQNSLAVAQENMLKITDSSKQITGVMGIIEDVSEQINLLSLNASIESARAGEYGRGFAVVAEEISKLADETGRSISNISLLVTNNNKFVKQGLESIEKAVSYMTYVVENIQNVNKTTEEMFENIQLQVVYNEDINKEMASVNTLNEDIFQSINNLTNGGDSILKSISEIGELSQLNAASAEELSANSEEIYGVSDTLKTITEKFTI